jgi:hypothetical protein
MEIQVRKSILGTGIMGIKGIISRRLHTRAGGKDRFSYRNGGN